MAQDYNAYLAGRVLNDGEIVTYRLLSRAIGVHVNEAKRMLYEFHRQQNAKKAGSVKANYLLAGYQRRKAAIQTNGDAHMGEAHDAPTASSPAAPSAGVSEAKVKVVALVDEGQLQNGKEQYFTLTAVHVYSIQLSTVKNFETVSSVNELVFTEHDGVRDLLTDGKTYGMLQNPDVKRRTAVSPSPIGSAAPQVPSQTPKATGLAARATAKELTKIQPAAAATPPPNPRPSTVKRESSNFFKSFAKTKVPPKAAKDSSDDDVDIRTRASTDTSARGAHSMPISSLSNKTYVKQEKMTDEGDGDDEDESEDEGGFVALNKKTGHGRKSKSERDEELRKKMFEDGDAEDVEMTDATVAVDATALSQKSLPDTEPEPEPEHEGMSQPIDTKQAAAEEPTVQQVTVSNGRRRGKRRVMRRRLIKDEEDFLVSKEEPMWESFSEEDVPQVKSKPATPSSSAASKKGSQTKKGQGTLTSFFGKK